VFKLLLSWRTAQSIGAFMTFALTVACVVPAVADAPHGKEPPPCTRSKEIQPICGMHGPEDIELTPDGKYLLISELPPDFTHPASGDGLLLVDLADNRVRPLRITSEPETAWGEPSCTAPPGQLGSHGIHVSKRSDGRMELLVVNHAERESIEAFELRSDAEGYKAVWHGCVTHPTGLLNDVAATGDGGFIASVTMEKTLLTRKDVVDVLLSAVDTGYLVEWHPGTGLSRLANSEAPGNNGVQLSADGHFVYFAAWTKKQIRRYDRQAQRVTQIVEVPFYPDNLSVRGDGVLIATGLDELESWRACTLAHSSFCETGFTVMTLNPSTLATELLYRGKPGILWGASVAIQVTNRLYVGASKGDRLLKIDLGRRAARSGAAH
jgi:sugar lactone lactonase YvrE